jgi:hypothetical protein
LKLHVERFLWLVLPIFAHEIDSIIQFFFKNMQYEIAPDQNLSLAEVADIIHHGRKLVLSDSAAAKIEECRNYLDSRISESGILEFSRIPLGFRIPFLIPWNSREFRIPWNSGKFEPRGIIINSQNSRIPGIPGKIRN